MLILTIVIISLVSLILFAVCQFFLCRKTKKLALKLIPGGISLLMAAGCLYLYFGDFPHAHRFFNVNEIYALLAAFPVAASMVGTAAGWIVAYITKK